MITRDEILRRARAVPLGVISYSQAATNKYTGRRSDCSGWISYCWDLPTSGPGTYLGAYSTSTLVTQALMRKVDRDELQPGDAIGYCGPTTAGGGGGHIALWLGKAGSKEHILDHGSGMGPKDRIVTWGYGSGWQAKGKIGAWRFVGLEGALPEGDDGNMYCKLNDSGRDVETLQRLILAAGGSLPRFGADGGYGGETKTALAALIAGAPNVTPDGSNYGPAEFVAVQVALAKRYAVAPTPPAVDPAVLRAAAREVLAGASVSTSLILPE